jgi:hypothetical protein
MPKNAQLRVGRRTHHQASRLHLILVRHFPGCLTTPALPEQFLIERFEFPAVTEKRVPRLAFLVDAVRVELASC